MKQSNIRKTLRMNGCKVWQLCKILGISRNHYYDLAHGNFKNHENQIYSGITKTVAIYGSDKKVGVDNAD